MKQHTIKADITINGVGLHSGAMVHMTLKPAAVDTGIVFMRTDIAGDGGVIPARWDRVADTRLCTVIANEAGARVGTVEHLMAALRGCGVDNVIVELDGAEVPVMDGSAAPFVARIDETGLTAQGKPRRALKILREVTVREEGKFARLMPAVGSIFGGAIEFDHPSIGRQTREITLVNGNFRHDLADARTFGFLHEVAALRKNGLAQGGSLENAIVLDEDKVLNEDGLRYGDEFIRHKLLDAIGDLYLAGAPILGAYDADKPGHALNNQLLHAVFADQRNYRWVEVTSEAEAHSPVPYRAVVSSSRSART